MRPPRERPPEDLREGEEGHGSRLPNLDSGPGIAPGAVNRAAKTVPKMSPQFYRRVPGTPTRAPIGSPRGEAVSKELVLRERESAGCLGEMGKMDKWGLGYSFTHSPSYPLRPRALRLPLIKVRLDKTAGRSPGNGHYGRGSNVVVAGEQRHLVALPL
jgi:hypothetical protein